MPNSAIRRVERLEQNKERKHPHSDRTFSVNEDAYPLWEKRYIACYAACETEAEGSDMVAKAVGDTLATYDVSMDETVITLEIVERAVKQLRAEGISV